MTHPLLLGAGGTGPDPSYKIARSVRFRKRATGSATRTFAAGNRKLWSFAGWIRRGNLQGTYQFVLGTGPDGFNYSGIMFGNDQLWFNENQAASTYARLITWNLFRDPTAWLHVVYIWDTAQAVASERQRVYVNGVRVTEFTQATYPAQNLDSCMNYPYGANYNWIGRYTTGPDAFDGNMAEVHFFDGIAADPSWFGAFNSITGQWQPKKYSGPTDHGINGYWLDFSDPSSAAALFYDRSGRGNHWTPSNISVAADYTYDSLTDTPTNVYPILNEAAPMYGVGYIQDGGLGNYSSTSMWGSNYATLGMSTGKWYCEVTVVDALGILGVCPASEIAQTRTSSYLGNSARSCGYGSQYKYNNGVATAWGAAWAANDVIGIYYDADAATVGFTRNGVDQGIAFSAVPWSTSLDPMLFGVGDASANWSCSCNFNFGQQPFKYTPPSGYKALCTANLPSPAMVQPRDAYGGSNWLGTGATYRVRGLRFQPDFTWIKNRSIVSVPAIWDSLRGPEKPLVPSSTDPELLGGLMSFEADGFVVNNGDWVNGLNNGMVAWNFKRSSAFDVVTYTGTGAAQNIPHALGKQPRFIIVKRIDAAANWPIWCQMWIGNTSAMFLNTTAGITAGDYWNNTDPTPAHFTVGTHADVNAAGGRYVAYVWCDREQLCAINWYQGNGSTAGPFIYTGFRPAFILARTVIAGYNWTLQDDVRDATNPRTGTLFANSTAAETGGSDVDLCATGFTVRIGTYNLNYPSQPHIYIAMAAAPAKYANAG